MLTVSLHGIKLHALIGLYPEEKIHGNNFEIDADLWLPDAQPWPYADYTEIHSIVAATFAIPGDLLETYVYAVHSKLAERFPIAERIKVTVRKLNPPLPGKVAYSQVCYDK